MKQLARLVMFTVSIACAAVSARAGVDRFTSISPEGADIVAIVIDPLNSSTIYASSQRRVFKSLDRGESWTVVFDLEMIRENPATQLSGPIGRLVMDPLRPSTVYATITIFRPGLGRLIGGIVKTENGGATWALLPGWRERDPLVDLVIDPSNPDTLYALTYSSLLQSTDRGLSWSAKSAGPEPILAGEFFSLAIDPSSPSRLYVGSKGGLYVSIDRGRVWQLLRPGGNYHRIVVDPADATTLYATSEGFLISSMDGGKTWTTLLTETEVFQIVVDPLSSAAYAVSARGDRIGIIVSTDRGQTWTPLPASRPSPTLLAVEPGSRVLYAAGQGDLFKSDNRGESWRPIRRGLTGLFVTDIAADPANSMTLFAGTRRGLLKSGDGGESWRDVNPDFPMANLSMDSRNPSNVFAYTQYATTRSTDGGETWTVINPGRSVRGIAVDPSDSANVYAVLSDGLSRSRDGGSTWTPIGVSQLPLGYYGLEGSAIAVDPVTPANVYAAGGGEIFKSVDAGTTWKTVLSQQNGSNGEYIGTLLIDPRTPSTIYALAYNKLYRSYNEGATWAVAYSRSREETFFTDLALDPLQPSRLYLATSNGLLKSEDGGHLWADFSEIRAFAVSTDLHGNVYASVGLGLLVYSPRNNSVRTPSVFLRTLPGNYVSANNCGGSFVDANALSAGRCEMFSIYDLNGGSLNDGDKIHLRVADGHFVAAENGGSVDGSAAPVNANRRLPAAWETFVIRRKARGTAIVSGDSIALQSVNGAYLTAESGGANNCDCDSRLNANRLEAREWETFVIEIR